MAQGPGIQVQAGVLTNKSGDERQLTTKAKQRFIEDVKKELQGLETGLPCGPKLQAIDMKSIERLDDPNEFPEFHENFLGTNSAYVQIARMLDVKGMNLLAPVIDPLMIYLSFGVTPPEIPFPPPFPPKLELIAPDLNIDVPKLAAKLPELKVPGFPPFELPPIPPNIDIRFDALIKFNIDLIKLTFDLAIKLPTIAANLPFIVPNIVVELPKLFCPLVDQALSGIDPRYVAQIAAMKVLANRAAECLAFDAIGVLLGCPDPATAGAPGLGMVGGYATTKGLGLKAKEEDVVSEVKKAQEKKKVDIENIRKSALQLVNSVMPSGYKQSSDPGQQKFQDITGLTLDQLKSKTYYLSTCGFLPHWMLYSLGCRQPEIVNRDDSSAGLKYEDAQNISKLRYGAQKLGAWVPYKKDVSPKPGDIVMIQNDAAVKGDPSLGTSSSDGDEPNYSSQHVFVFLEEEAPDESGKALWRSCDAGLGGVGTQYANYVYRYRLNGGKTLTSFSGKTKRNIAGWVDISKLKYG